MIRATCVALIVLAAGCTYHQPPISRHSTFAREATDDQVTGCEFLQTVYGGTATGATIFSGGASAEESIRKMLARATEIGATHVVVGDVDSNLRGGANATGRAYRCEFPEPVAE